MLSSVFVINIHSKSEFRDCNGATKKIEICPRNGQKWPKMAQSGPNMTQNGPRMTQNGPKIARTFSAIFFDWKVGSANFFAFRMYGEMVGGRVLWEIQEGGTEASSLLRERIRVINYTTTCKWDPLPFSNCCNLECKAIFFFRCAGVI